MSAPEIAYVLSYYTVSGKTVCEESSMSLNTHPGDVLLQMQNYPMRPRERICEWY